jgi:hypothetical protein
MDPALKTALANLIPVILGVLATGLVGTGLGFWWNLQLKNRESDLATVKMFHDSYGEFFAVWKLWNYYIRDIGLDAFPDASRWDLLQRPPLPKAGWKRCSWASRPNIGVYQNCPT